MSLILRQTHGHPQLERVVREASQSAVIFCSTADEGYNNPKVWPAYFEKDTISIASCNYQGVPTSWSTVEGTKFFLHVGVSVFYPQFNLNLDVFVVLGHIFLSDKR